MTQAPETLSADKIVWSIGTIKWFDPVRRWGFVSSSNGGPDVFLPWTVLQSCAIPEKRARPGVAVRFRWEPAPVDKPWHRPKVTHLVLVT